AVRSYTGNSFSGSDFHCVRPNRKISILYLSSPVLRTSQDTILSAKVDVRLKKLRLSL
ncbi:hypothetical protein CANTEDRAFT_113209, partial [Yamadazyma tenuis ATCC 10573]